MSGIENDVLVAKNVNFDSASAPPHNGIITAAGMLQIGSGNLFPTPEILAGNLVSPLGTITIGYLSPNITLDLTGGSSAIERVTVDANTAPGTNPVIPNAGNINIFGRSGSKTISLAANTLTVKSPNYSDQGGSTTVLLNTGSFATAAITLTTPASAGLLDGDLLEFVATNGVLVIQLAATQVAHIGTIATSVAGTITSTNTGDALALRYQVSTNDWWATSVVGVFVLA